MYYHNLLPIIISEIKKYKKFNIYKVRHKLIRTVMIMESNYLLRSLISAILCASIESYLVHLTRQVTKNSQFSVSLMMLIEIQVYLLLGKD